MPEFVERNLEERNFYGRIKPNVVFNGDDFAARKRKINREKIARERGIPMPPAGRLNEHTQEGGEADFNAANNRPKRRTRGKGRKVNYKQL